MNSEQSVANLKVQELQNCNFVKIVLMIFVILGHSTALWSSSGWFNQPPVENSNFCLWTIRFLGHFHIYGFVLVSGYIFSYIRFEKNGYKKMVPFILNKSKRLLVPYIFVSIIWVVPWNLLYFDNTVKELCYKFLLGVSPAQLWFILMLFNVFLIGFFIIPLLYDKPVLGCVICFVLWGIGTLGLIIFPNVFQLFTSLQYFLIFYIGVQMRHYSTYIFRKIPNIVYLVFYIILLIIYINIDQNTGYIWKCVSLPIALLLHIVGAVSSFIILTNIAEYVSIEKSKVLSFLNVHSFNMYLFHQQIIYGIITLLNGRISPIVIAAVCFLFSIVVSGIMSLVFSKNKLTRFLLGLK